MLRFLKYVSSNNLTDFRLRTKNAKHDFDYRVREDVPVLRELITPDECVLLEVDQETVLVEDAMLLGTGVRVICNLGSVSAPYNHDTLKTRFKSGIWPVVWGVDTTFVRSNVTLDKKHINASKKPIGDPEDGIAVFSVIEDQWITIPFPRLIHVGKKLS